MVSASKELHQGRSHRLVMSGMPMQFGLVRNLAWDETVAFLEQPKHVCSGVLLRYCLATNDCHKFGMRLAVSHPISS